MDIYLTVGILSMLVCGVLAQVFRWLWMLNLLPPLVFILGLLVVVFILFCAWFQWLKYLQTDSYSLFGDTELERFYPVALGLVGLIFGLI